MKFDDGPVFILDKILFLKNHEEKEKEFTEEFIYKNIFN
jgi:hypothetical protein